VKFMHKYTDGLNIERFAAGWQGMALMEPLEVFASSYASHAPGAGWED
jgi:hypothetical protein